MLANSTLIHIRRGKFCINRYSIFLNVFETSKSAFVVVVCFEIGKQFARTVQLVIVYQFFGTNLALMLL